MSLKRYGFELNYKKCQFLKRTIEFLGFVIAANSITLSPRHTEAVRKFRQPRNVHETQQFQGLASYFRKFVKNFATKACPLYNLLKKDVIFEFDDACVDAFELLKRELASSPILALYCNTIPRQTPNCTQTRVAGGWEQSCRNKQTVLGFQLHILVKRQIKQRPGITVSSLKC